MPNQHSSAKQIFWNALEIAASGEREAYLEEACHSDQQLRARVDRLLAAAESNPDSFLGSPVVATVDFIEPSTLVGAQIGPFKLREQIGEGGMGIVYVAEQTEPVKRKVALKIIKPGMDSAQVIARFEAERQALAMMDHPNIARILDAGTLESPLAPMARSVRCDEFPRAGTHSPLASVGRGVGGEGLPAEGTAAGDQSSAFPNQPYFVMELVYGIPITEYCDQHQLTTRERLEIFLRVCRAVQHAHQKGVIHRDLKPTNVLVATVDGQAVPKVIDFGVAKAAGNRLTDATVYTQFSQLIGTPLYMSPEQAELGVADVDTRSDVYSLGVLLYELLTGSTPFDSETLKSAGIDEMRRIIREDEPLKPSAMVSTLKAEALSTVSQRRGSDPRKLSEGLSGELDWLVMKALEKDRNRRYESASALADDVERYLADEPIAAGPPSAAYRVKKYAQRNKGRLIATALAAAVLLIGGGITINAQVQQARQQRAIEQDVELSLAEARTAIETGDLAVAQQLVSEAEGRITDAKEQLHDLAGRVAALNTEVCQRRAELERLELFERRLLDAIVKSFFYSTDGVDRVDRVREALSTYGVLRDDRWWEKVQQSYLSQQQQSRARRLAYEAILLMADWVDEENGLELLERATKFREPTHAFYWLRSHLYERTRDTEKAEQDRRELAATPASTAFDYYLPAVHAADDGDHKEAIRACQSALMNEPNHFPTLFLLGTELRETGEAEDAINVQRACLALRPDDPRQYLVQLANMSRVADYKGALAMTDHALKIAERTANDDVIGRIHFDRGLTLRDLGRNDEAIISLTKAIEVPVKDVARGMDYVSRGEIYYLQGRHQEAIADYDRAIESFSRLDATNPLPQRIRTYINRSIIQSSAGDYEDSIAGIREAIEVFPDNADLYRNLAGKLLSPGNYAEALEFATKAVELEPENEDREKLALAQYRTGDYAGAVDTYMRMSKHIELDAEKLLVLAMAHQQLGHPEEARAWYARALKAYPKALEGIAKFAEPEKGKIPDKKMKASNEAYLAEIRSEAEQLLGITEQDVNSSSDAQADDPNEPTDPSRDGEVGQTIEK